MGHGWPFETTPGAAPERGKSERSEDPDAGVCFFCLLCFAQAKKSEAPCGAQQELPINRNNQSGTEQKSYGLPILPSTHFTKHQPHRQPDQHHTHQPVKPVAHTGKACAHPRMTE